MSRTLTDAEPIPSGAQLTDLTVPELLRIFKLLADETRLRILVRLMQSGEQHVRSLCDYLDQGQPAVSHHLALLRQAGLIACRRSGKHNFYRLCSPWLRTMLHTWTQPASQATNSRPHHIPEERASEDHDDRLVSETAELLV